MLYLGLALLFVVTGLLTAAEMATFSARPERMRQVAKAGDRRGTMVLSYQRSPVPFLSAGQVLATAGSFVTGAILSQAVTPDLVKALRSAVPWTTGQIEAVASTIVLTVSTVVALVTTNVIPKQIGFDHADDVAVFFAWPFRWLIRLTRPLAWVVIVAGQVAERVVNRNRPHGSRVTEADLLTLMAEGLRIGALDRKEAGFVVNALHLSDRKVADVMTPVDRIEALDARWGQDRIDAAVRGSAHSFLPVYDGTMDRPVGAVRARDWLTDGRVKGLDALVLPVATLSTDDTAVRLFEALQAKEARLVFVQNGDGNTVGMLTLNDAVALLAGDLAALRA
ncbi:MAG: DUF21 domain-containing protein [Armatimonadetes bacterium]|nr:DUF21 domain-containing protein [Armatimonadota bacterium]